MTTWRRGRAIVARIIRRGHRGISDVISEAIAAGVSRVPGTAVYMFKDPGNAPPALVANLQHNRVLHETTVILSVASSEQPRVEADQQNAVTPVDTGVYQVVLTFGYMDEPDVMRTLRDVQLEDGWWFDPDTATFFIGRETVTSTPAGEMPVWREQLFVLLNRGAASASRFYHLPSEQVFEVGTHVEI
jgi:KUP system potassium uptake protein